MWSRASRRASRWVLLEHDGELGGEQLARAEHGAGSADVLGRHEVGVGAVGRPRGELQHAGPEGGEHDGRRDRRLGRRVHRRRHRLEVPAHVVERPVVALAAGLDDRAVTDAEPGDEPTGERLGHGADGRRGGERVAAPHAGDAGGDDDRGRVAEQGGRTGERLLAAGRLAEPEGGVAERFDLSGHRPIVVERRAVPALPDAHAAQSHGEIVYEVLAPDRRRGAHWCPAIRRRRRSGGPFTWLATSISSSVTRRRACRLPTTTPGTTSTSARSSPSTAGCR